MSGREQSRKMALKKGFVRELRVYLRLASLDVRKDRRSCWEVIVSVDIVFHEAMRHPERHHGVQASSSINE